MKINAVNRNSTIFQLYCGSQFYWWRKPDKTKDLSQVRQTLSHNVVLSTPRLSRHWSHR